MKSKKPLLCTVAASLFAATLLPLLGADLPLSNTQSSGSAGYVQQGPISKGLRVLTIGHSFHAMYAPAWISDMAKSAGIKGHEIAGVSMIGGSRVIQHWDASDDKHRAKEILATGNVDVVTMSPMTKPDEGIDKFTELGLAHNPNIRITVQEFWLPYDSLRNFTQEEQKYARDWVDTPALSDPAMDKTNTGNFNIPTANQLRKLHELYFKTMDDYIRNLNQKLGKQVVFIVPVGQAVIALREKVIEGKVPLVQKQSDLFRDKLGHGTEVIEALASYCHFAVIYRRSPIGLPMPERLAKKYNNQQLNRLLQELAWDAVIHHPLSGVKATDTGGSKN